MGRWEWIILELGFLGLLIFELVSVRRAVRKDKLAKTLPAARDAEGQHGLNPGSGKPVHR